MLLESTFLLVSPCYHYLLCSIWAALNSHWAALWARFYCPLAHEDSSSSCLFFLYLMSASFLFPPCSPLSRSPQNLNSNYVSSAQILAVDFLIYQSKLTGGQVTEATADSRFGRPALSITIDSRRQKPQL